MDFRMENSGAVLLLQDYINNVDQSNLPRILQVCSGVYFQGKKAVNNTEFLFSYKHPAFCIYSVVIM